jgi:hypothetical protein
MLAVEYSMIEVHLGELKKNATMKMLAMRQTD